MGTSFDTAKAQSLSARVLSHFETPCRPAFLRYPAFSCGVQRNSTRAVAGFLIGGLPLGRLGGVMCDIVPVHKTVDKPFDCLYSVRTLKQGADMTLFTRSGQETLPAGTNDKGRPYYTYQTACHRCGGLGGGEQWAHTGWTCFQCGGTGNKQTVRAPLYTVEELAKLNATQAKRQAKAAAKKAQKDAERAVQVKVQAEAWIAVNRPLYDALCEFQANTFLADMLANIEKWGCLTDAQVAAAHRSIEQMRRAAVANYVGTIGQRVELTITVEKTVDITPPDSRFGRRWLYICHDENGNAIIYRGNSWSMPAEGQTGKIKAKVEEHTEYRGLKQTIISRPTAPKVAEQKEAA